LVAQRLSATCGHQHKAVMPLYEVGDGGLLITLEGVKAEMSLQFFV
jgi:hypothetical protein